jgi:hypothetical protein
VGAIADRHVKARCEQPIRHGTAHLPDADNTDLHEATLPTRVIEASMLTSYGITTAVTAVGHDLRDCTPV